MSYSNRRTTDDVVAVVNLRDISPHQIELWILQSNDPTNRSIQLHATQCLQQYISIPSITSTTSSSFSDDRTKCIIHTLFTVLSTTLNPMIQFYVLSTLHRVQYFLSLSNVQRIQLRHYLLETGICCTTTPTTTTTKIIIPNYIRNKVATILSTFLIQDTSINVMMMNGDTLAASVIDPKTRRNWTSVTNDMMLLAQQNPHLFLQTIIYVLEDIMMSTTSSSTDDDDDEFNGNSSSRGNKSRVISTADDIRQFKDILKGYHHVHDAAVVMPNPITLLQYLFQMVIQIYESTFHRNISDQARDTMDDPDDDNDDGPIILLAVTVIRNAFTWTTMEFLGSDQLMLQLFQLMINTVHRYHNTSSFSNSIQYDIIKAIFACWKEFVTSCNMSPPPVTSTSSSFKSQALHQVDLPSSIQSLSDPKLPIISHLIDCINVTKLLPLYNHQKCATSGTSSIPNLMVMSAASTDESSVSSDLMEVIISMAAFINAVALEIVPLYEHEVLMINSPSTPSDSKLQTLFQKIFELAVRTFAYDDIDVSTEILPFIVRLSHYMVEANGNNTNMVEEHGSRGDDLSNQNRVSQHFIHLLPLILSILYEQMKYPPDFAYGNDENDDEDDDEVAEEIIFRTELCKVYKKLVSAAPSICLQSMQDSFTAIAVKVPQSGSQPNTLNLAAASTPEIEALLRLLYVFCEAIRPAPGLKVVMQIEAFCNILQTLHQSNIAQHPHRAVLCLYYDSAVRYYPFYVSLGNVNLLSKLLNEMTGACGLQHQHPSLRSRCCFLFLKLIQVTISLLAPYVEVAVTGILSLLNNPGLSLRAEDTLYLFEAIGLLLGKSGLDPTQQQQHLGAVIAPHVRTIENALAVINQGLLNAPETIPPEHDDIMDQTRSTLSSSIAAITNLSKGFTKPSDGIAMLLTDTLHITLNVLHTLPNDEQIRNKSMVLVQRMILCIGENVLSTAPIFLQCFVQCSTCDDILFVAQILNQLCIKFKQKAIPAIDAAVLPFLEKCQSMEPSLYDNINDIADEVVPPHLEAEQLAIRKLSYIVLQHIVTYQATGVLFTPTNVEHLESLLRLVLDGAINVSDPTVKKTCLRFFRALIDQVKTLPKATIEFTKRYEDGILLFAGESVIPNIFQVLTTSSTRRQYISDPNGARVTVELSQLMNTFRLVCDSEIEHKNLYRSSIDFLKQKLSSHNVDGSLLQEHLQQAASANDFVIIIQNVIKECIKK